MTVGQWKNALLNNGTYMTFGALGGFLRTPKNPPGYGPGWCLFQGRSRGQLISTMNFGTVLSLLVASFGKRRATISRSTFFVKFLWTGARTWYLSGTRFNTHRSTRQVPGTFNGRVAISKSWLDMRYESVCLWSPYGIGQTIIFLPCGFFLSSFFSRLISAASDCLFHVLHVLFLQTDSASNVTMAALRSRCGHYIFAL